MLLEDTKDQIQIPVEYKDYAVIAQIKTGEKKDSEHIGFAAKDDKMRGTFIP